jgi:hypothetical protein
VVGWPGLRRSPAAWRANGPVRRRPRPARVGIRPRGGRTVRLANLHGRPGGRFGRVASGEVGIGRAASGEVGIGRAASGGRRARRSRSSRRGARRLRRGGSR